MTDWLTKGNSSAPNFVSNEIGIKYQLFTGLQTNPEVRDEIKKKKQKKQQQKKNIDEQFVSIQGVITVAVVIFLWCRVPYPPFLDDMQGRGFGTECRIILDPMAV